MRGVLIYHSRVGSIISYGNGWAYTLACVGLVKTVWLQDIDATDFRDKFERIDKGLTVARSPFMGEDIVIAKDALIREYCSA